MDASKRYGGSCVGKPFPPVSRPIIVGARSVNMRFRLFTFSPTLLAQFGHTNRYL
jgi:hypothetical protein